jgi:transaldolase/transaldolase/glucose-6-phosphate isomerase
MEQKQRATDVNSAVWLDTIDRAIIESGQLEHLVEAGLSGVVSRPVAVAKTMRYRDDYNQLLRDLTAEGKSVEEMVEAVLIEDVQTAADQLHPVFEDTERLDGYVSLDINPALEHDTEGLVSEALRLKDDVDRTNVMLQVPASPSGVRALETLTAEGVNVNATLICTPDTYEAVAKAYVHGLGMFLKTLDIWPATPTSVASVSIAWLDEAVNERLRDIGTADARALLGKIGPAVARIIYERYETIFAGAEWQKLTADAAHTVRAQRPMWVESAVPILAGTINSLPPKAAQQLLAHPVAKDLSLSLAEAEEQLTRLTEMGVNLEELEERLQREGHIALRDAYDRLATIVVEKRDLLQKIA